MFSNQTKTIIMKTTFYVELSQDMFVSWQKRLLHLVIDFIAIMLFAFVFMFGLMMLSFLGFEGLGYWIDGLTDNDYNLLWVIFMLIYYIGMEAAMQKTLGKIITGTIVVSETGSKPAFKNILGRSLCRIFSIEAFSFLGSYPRGWHDSASGTYVVDAKKYNKALEIKYSFDEIGKEILDVQQA